MNRLGIVFLISIWTLTANAQEFAYGFKVGLNFSTLTADSETDADGNNLETFDYNSGFHVGAAIIYRLTDLVGFRGELLYSQRGLKYAYEGPSFQYFTDNTGAQILSQNGTRRYFSETVNSYIKIPLTAYYKIGEKIEVYGGVDVGFLIGSTAVGEYTYEGPVPGFPDFNGVFELDYNYFSDDVAANTTINGNADMITIMNNTRNITVPEKVGAYYLDYPEKEGSFYNIFDFGLTGGMAFYINSGLFVSGTVNYGLTDATNNFYDISRVATDDDGEYISRNDKDTNLSFKASIGFSF